MPKSGTYIWTNERIIRLIREYRKRPVLWDAEDPWFHNRTDRKNCWNDIAKVFNAPPTTCKGKMKSLLSSLRKEKKKGSSNWPMFSHMKFLLEKSKQPKKINSNQDTTMPSGQDSDVDVGGEDDGDDDKESSVTSDVIDTEPTTLKIENDTDSVSDDEDNCSSQPLKSNTAAKTLSSVPTQPTAPSHQPGPSQAQVKDIQNEQTKIYEEIDAFTKFVNTKMKKYSMSTVNQVQRQICEILFKIDETILPPAPNPNTTQIIIADVIGNNFYACPPTLNTMQVSNNITMNK